MGLLGWQLMFAFELQSREHADLRIVYADKLVPAPVSGIRYGIKVHMRRYLSEYRDEYLSRSKSDTKCLPG
jgi:hypothetical protein